MCTCSWVSLKTRRERTLISRAAFAPMSTSRPAPGHSRTRAAATSVSARSLIAGRSESELAPDSGGFCEGREGGRAGGGHRGRRRLHTGRTTSTRTSSPHPPRTPPSFLPSFLPSFTVWTARSADRRRRRCGVIKLDVQDKGRNIADAAAAAAAPV